MLYTASFYVPQNWVGTAYRVSRAHPRGRKTQWDTLPFFYPDRALLQTYRAGELDFPAFGTEYRRSLDARLEEEPALREWLEQIMPALEDFTLLCFEREGQPCHRRVLAEWLQEQVPGLEVGELR